MQIHLLTVKNGKTVLNSLAKPGVSLQEIVELAENEVNDGYADYANVIVNGKLYKRVEK